MAALFAVKQIGFAAGAGVDGDNHAFFRAVTAQQFEIERTPGIAFKQRFEIGLETLVGKFNSRVAGQGADHQRQVGDAADRRVADIGHRILEGEMLPAWPQMQRHQRHAVTAAIRQRPHHPRLGAWTEQAQRALLPDRQFGRALRLRCAHLLGRAACLARLLPAAERTVIQHDRRHRVARIARHQGFGARVEVDAVEVEQLRIAPVVGDHQTGRLALVRLLDRGAYTGVGCQINRRRPTLGVDHEHMGVLAAAGIAQIHQAAAVGGPLQVAAGAPAAHLAGAAVAHEQRGPHERRSDPGDLVAVG